MLAFYLGDNYNRLFNRITEIYFNPKRSADNSKAYIGLEVSDLCAYPIYKYCRYGTDDKAFHIVDIKKKKPHSDLSRPSSYDPSLILSFIPWE